MIGFIASLTTGPHNGLRYGLIGGAIYGLIGGPIGTLGVGSFNHITLVETVSWKWDQFWIRAVPGFAVGALVGCLSPLTEIEQVRLHLTRSQ